MLMPNARVSGGHQATAEWPADSTHLLGHKCQQIADSRKCQVIDYSIITSVTWSAASGPTVSQENPCQSRARGESFPESLPFLTSVLPEAVSDLLAHRGVGNHLALVS